MPSGAHQTAAPPRLRSCSRYAARTSRPSWSRLFAGSSSRMRAGSWTNVIASRTRCRCPIESLSTRRSAKSSSPKTPSARSIAPRALAGRKEREPGTEIEVAPGAEARVEGSIAGREESESAEEGAAIPFRMEAIERDRRPNRGGSARPRSGAGSSCRCRSRRRSRRARPSPLKDRRPRGRALPPALVDAVQDEQLIGGAGSAAAARASGAAASTVTSPPDRARPPPRSNRQSCFSSTRPCS